MIDLVISIDNAAYLDDVETIVSERLRQKNVNFSIKTNHFSDGEQIAKTRELLTKPIFIGSKFAIKALTARNRHLNLLKDFDAQGKLIVNIDPGSSFGVGTHPTTQMCVEAIEKYLTDKSNILDVGCGSGVLSIISLLLGAKHATGVDIESTAIQTSMKNAELNNVSDRFTSMCGNLTDTVNGTYDLIVANILADPIKSLLKDLKDYTHKDSIVVLSGIIDFREDEVVAVAMKNFDIVERSIRDNWICLVLKPKQN